MCGWGLWPLASCPLVELGFETETGDTEGDQVGESKDWSHVTSEDVHTACAKFVGEISQVAFHLARPSGVRAGGVRGGGGMCVCICARAWCTRGKVLQERGAKGACSHANITDTRQYT